MAIFKDKERILKAAREKQIVIYKRTPIDCHKFSAETLLTRKEWHNIIKMMKEKKERKKK